MTPIMMITLFTGHMLLSPATSVTQEYAGEFGAVQRPNGAVAVRKSIDGFGSSTGQFKTPASTNELTISQGRTKNMDNTHGNSSIIPPDGYFSIWLMEGGTEAILIGDIAHGVATELVKFINQTPKVRTIGFYSGGGRISEAKKIRDIIRARKFDTYVYKQCLSSCTIAYSGGVNRYMEPNYQLGFHRASSPDRIEFDSTLNRDQVIIDDLISIGVGANFAQKAFRTPSNDMWYPDVEELIQSNFVTGISNGRFSTAAAVKKQYAVDSLEIAIEALERGDYKNTIRLFRPLAEGGHAFSQFILGTMYSNGKGVPQNYKESVKWYRLAAEQGYAAAQNNIGLAYSQGRGVPRDEAQAVTWFRKAAEQGEKWAQANLARRYNEGIGMPQDYKEAAKWYGRAAEQGNAFAQNRLGFMYGVGQGLPQNDVLAHMWLDIAASKHRAGTKDRAWAIENRERLAAKMTPAQIGEAERLAREFWPK